MTSGEVVLVTGATGAIGPAVVAELLLSGYRVRAFSRTPPVHRFPENVDVRLGDITDARAVRSAVEDASAVMHLAARLHLAGPPSRDLGAYQTVNVEGTAIVVAAAGDASVRRVIFASTIAVYGPTAGKPATEYSALNPETPYARTKLLAEDIVRQAAARSGEPIGTVLRLAAIYGPKVKGNYRALVETLAANRFVPVGNGRNRRTLVHERDAARAMVQALESPAAAGQTYNVTDGSVHTTDDIVGAICAALGRPRPRCHIPRSIAFAAAAVFDAVTGLAGREGPALVDRLTRYTEDVAVDGQAIQREVGFSPMYSLEDGWKQAIAGMRAEAGS